MDDKNMITIGELAKTMGVSVRTLQYYDKINLLKPTKISEGKRRLYSKEDMAMLHQILTLKHLKLSLDDIKRLLIPINNKDDVIKVLKRQEDILKAQISNLQKSLKSVTILNEEISLAENIDWEKYACMVNLIEENNKNYWILRYFDIKTVQNLKNKYDNESAEKFVSNWKNMCIEAALLYSKKVSPESNEGQKLAKRWWDMIMDFSNGDITILNKLFSCSSTLDEWPDEYKLLQKKADPFIGLALKFFFEHNNIDISMFNITNN